MISAHNVGKKYYDQWIFKDLTLEVAEKESAILLGPSGGGKSLLLKILTGLISADAGEVKLKSSNIGMLFQKNALFNYLTVEENLRFPLQEVKNITGSAAQQITSRFLKDVGLTGSEDLYPDEISGGMQKRLGIARALILNPEIIFYDEPTAGLDPITSKTIAELIQHLRRESGSTLLTVTNDVQRAYQLGDTIYLLAQGQLIKGGTPKEVQTSTDPRIRQFIYGLKKGPLTAES